MSDALKHLETVLAKQKAAKESLDKLKKEEQIGLPSYEELKLAAKQPKEHMCERCVADYKKYNEEQRKKDPEWEDRYPICKGSKEVFEYSLEEFAHLLGVEPEEAEDDYDFMRINADPVLWAGANLGVTFDGVHYDKEGNEINADRWHQKEVLRCSSQFKVYLMGRRCIPGDEPVLMWDGSIKNIQDIVPGDKVLSMNDVSRPSPGLVTNLYNNGVQQVYRVTLTDGREIRCTGNHPLLAWSFAGTNGNSKCQYRKQWKSVEQGLSKKDKVYALTRYEKFGTDTDLNKAAFLGYFLADGYYGGKSQTPKFTSCTDVYLEEMKNLSTTLFGFPGKIRCREESAAKDVYFTDGKKGTASVANSWLESLGITGPKNKRQSIMTTISNFSAEALGVFINRLWSGDGCVSLWDRKDRLKNGQAVELSLTTSDAALARNVQGILYKVGVASRISSERRKSPRSEHIGEYWKLRIADLTSVRNFFKFTGLIYGKEENSQKALIEIEKRTRSLGRHKGVNFHRVKVKSVELLGDFPTYDITVDKYHNFTVNGIVTHNSGKTFSMRLETLHFMMTTNNARVLLICPYEKQVIAFLKELDEFLEKNESLGRTVKHRSKSKHTLTLNNGSHLESVMTGGDKAGGGSKARGQPADLLIFDEVDFVAPGDIEAAIAILADNPNCKILASSTPTGKRQFLYDVVTNKARRYKAFRFTSHVSPVFTKVADDEIRAASSSAAYRREILGDFGDEAAGVFSQLHIDRSLRPYQLTSERAKGPLPGWIYMVGVDWNGRAIGTHIVVTGFNPQSRKYRMVDKVVVANEAYTQISGCKAIVDVFHYWGASFIYTDFGFGEVQTELISRHATQTNDQKLAIAFKPIIMHGSTEIRNAVSGQLEKKNNQQLAIDLLAHHLEQGLIELPAAEDFMSGDEAEMGIVSQMRHFVVERISAAGKNIYSGVDHTLTAFYLTILAFQIEKTSLGQTRYDNKVIIRPTGDLADGETVQGVLERERDRKKEKGLAPGMLMQRSMDKVKNGPNYGKFTTVVEDGKNVGMQEIAGSGGIKGQIAMKKKGVAAVFNAFLYKRKSF